MMKKIAKTGSKKVIVVMPAYNAEKTLKKTYDDIPKKIVSKVILIDDGSRDKTVLVAKKLGLETVVHPQNRGYGGNQKTCYTLAVSEGADVVVMIHPDYQYDSTLTAEMVNPILKGKYDMMFGSRIRTKKEALAGGMPLYKYVFNRFLTITQNIILGQHLSEYHTGFRAYNKKLLQTLPFHKFSDDFVFDQDMSVSAVYSKFKIGEIPVPVRYFKEASSINLKRSLKYGIEVLIDLVKFLLASWGIYYCPIFARKR